MATFPLRTLLDVTKAQAQIAQALNAGSVIGEVGERIAAHVTGSKRVNGKGRDLARLAPPGWVRPQPFGLAARGSDRLRHNDAASTWAPADRQRLLEWQANSSLQLGEVKARRAAQDLDGTERWPLDTRRGGNDSVFFPCVDFYVFLLFDAAGDVLMCRELTLAEVVEFAETPGRRGGSWNHRIAIHTAMVLGKDRTDAARAAAALLPAEPEQKSRLADINVADTLLRAT
jgi:hypothetical protein